MELRKHEMELADEIAQRVAILLRDGKTSRPGDVPAGQVTGVLTMATCRVPGSPTEAEWLAIRAADGGAPAVPLGVECAMVPQQELDDLRGGELREAELVEALAQSHAALGAVAKRLDVTNAAVKGMCTHADATLRQLFTLTPQPIDGGQRVAYPLTSELIVRLRKVQQHVDALERIAR